MICTLICKKREAEDGRKWVNYSMLKGKQWYNVKFVKECAPPQVHKIADGIGRSFISLTADHKYDLREQDNSSTLFVESYDNLNAEELRTAILSETEKVEQYRKEREKARVNFLMPADDTTMPF